MVVDIENFNREVSHCCVNFVCVSGLDFDKVAVNFLAVELTVQRNVPGVKVNAESVGRNRARESC